MDSANLIVVDHVSVFATEAVGQPFQRRLLIISKHYPPAVDGVGDHTFHFKSWLEKRGWQVSVYTASLAQGAGSGQLPCLAAACVSP